MSNVQYASPKINALVEHIKSGDIDSINLFWRHIERHGAPLIEEIEGDNENVLITFLYRSDSNAIDNMHNVLLAKGCDVKYEHFASGHDYLSWGETLANGLIELTERV